MRLRKVCGQSLPLIRQIGPDVQFAQLFGRRFRGGANSTKRTLTKYPILRVDGPAHRCRGCWQPIAVWAALQAWLAGATLAVKSDSKDRASGT
jgi:hypothetical protein